MSSDTPAMKTKNPFEDPDVARAFVKHSANLSRAQSSDGATSSSPAPKGSVVTNQVTSSSGCPVIGADRYDERNLMPAPQGNNAPVFPDQKKPLNVDRQVSSIPTAETSEKEGNWVYPSEQMFYNAMKRKGWTPSEEDMTAVVAIHNAVNERAWREIISWEAHQGVCDAPRLVKFRGRPRDYSPKARILNMLGYKLPFDRHDWIVDRCGREVRYVIDFYNGASMPNMPAAVHLDVRPALDSPSLLMERLRMQCKHVYNLFFLA
jgi:cytochrome c heme-lyase